MKLTARLGRGPWSVDYITMKEQTHDKSLAAVPGIYNATVQNQRCRALLDCIIRKEITINAPPKVRARAKDRSTA